MTDVMHPGFRHLLNQFNQCLKDCHRLYLESANIVIDCYPDLLVQTPEGFREMMDDLHRGFLVKMFVSVAHVDQMWTRAEELLASVLFFHLWHRQLDNERLRMAIRKIRIQSERLNWDTLVQPFHSIGPLRPKMVELETVVMRMGNVIAKADGPARTLELEQLANVQGAIFQTLHSNDEKWSINRVETRTANQAGQQVLAQMQRASSLNDPIDVPSETQVDRFDSETDGLEEVVDNEAGEKKATLQEALDELNELIGMKNVKKEVNTLINFLKVQKMRKEAGLRETKISLHMVFGGNPGTGKTTVARILGKIYGAMGILKRGHLIETDRSGLVAEYAGQTAPKTNKIIDDALDGVLFIDEAYSLVSSKGDDAFGAEAIQTLLKRMEDDRDRLIVILAGYPTEMQNLLQTNPGLSSRFGHRIEFEDYKASEMGRIFGLMCEKNQYLVGASGRAKLLAGFKWMYENRDRHFGNGRTVRNIFENAVRQLANRIVSLPTVTNELLTTFEYEDIILNVPSEVLHDFEDGENQISAMRFVLNCPQCGEDAEITVEFLGRKVKCKKCDCRFVCQWCEPVV